MKKNKVTDRSSDLQPLDQMAEPELSRKVTGEGMIEREMLDDEGLDVETVSKMLKQAKNASKSDKTADDQEHILAIIPCFNEEATIGSVIVKTRKYVDEVVVVDDGSTDDTVKIAKELGATVLSHKMNLGKSAGIKTGFKYALDDGFDYVITLDGDGQHDPDEIPCALAALKDSEVDIAIGIRAGEKTEMPFYRRIGKRVLDYATSMGNGGYLTDSQSGFRVYTRGAIRGIAPKLRGSAFSTESEQLLIASDLSLSMNTFPITCRYKSVGDSSITSSQSPTKHGFSVLGYVMWVVAERRPLLFIGLPGFAFVIFGIFFGILTLQLYNKTGVFPISYALITGVVLIIGALGVFIGLLFNTIPHIVKRTLDEKEMEDFARNHKPKNKK